MKIGILTQPLDTNYGGLIQNYALQIVLKRLGHEVLTFNWEYKHMLPPDPYLLQIKKALSKVINFLLRRNKKYYTPKSSELALLKENTQQFIDRFISSSSVLKSEQDFKKLAEDFNADGYIVGSDQCWRPICNRFLYEMFLNFTHGQDIKRMSYAASFGVDSWEYTLEQTNICGELVKKFDIVTVRETSGINLCREYLNVFATQVLDPTMLLTSEDYANLINGQNTQQGKGELFCYILDPNPLKERIIQTASEQVGYEPFAIMPQSYIECASRVEFENKIDNYKYPSPLQWLRSFMDAKMIIVDSFHGCVFSIIFNKPFWVIGNKERGNTRFTSLLQMFGLEDRLITDFEGVDLKSNINWEHVNEIIAQKRSESMKVFRLFEE